MKILLDTSAYVAFKHNHTGVVERIIGAELILFSPIVLGELLLGFRNGKRFDKNQYDLRFFLENEAIEFIPIDKTTSDRYSRIASQLKQQGTPIPTNDIWIAAQVFEYGAELITSDRHFEKIPSLVYTIF